MPQLQNAPRTWEVTSTEKKELGVATRIVTAQRRYRSMHKLGEAIVPKRKCIKHPMFITTWPFQQIRIGHMHTHFSTCNMYLFVLLLSSLLEPNSQFVGTTSPVKWRQKLPARMDSVMQQTQAVLKKTCIVKRGALHIQSMVVGLLLVSSHRKEHQLLWMA